MRRIIDVPQHLYGDMAPQRLLYSQVHRGGAALGYQVFDLVTRYCNCHSRSTSKDPSAPSRLNPAALRSREAEALDMTLASISLIATRLKEGHTLSLAQDKLWRAKRPGRADHLVVCLESIPVTNKRPLNTRMLSSVIREALEGNRRIEVCNTLVEWKKLRSTRDGSAPPRGHARTGCCQCCMRRGGPGLRSGRRCRNRGRRDYGHS